MSNQRSVMTEFRFLDQKRQAEGLSAEEATRYAQLRDLVGPETAGPPRSGFDVNAAAARLRESLLPAGLRGRAPEPPAPAVLPEPTPEPPPEALALEQAWAEAPFTDLRPEPADPLFDPGSLAQEVKPQAWNPDAPGYDPDAPFDEAAWIAAGYDPNATYDWSAYGAGTDGQPVAAETEPAPEAAAPPGPGGAEPFAPLQGAPVEAVEPDVAADVADALGGWTPAPEVAPATLALDEVPPLEEAPPIEGMPVEGAPEAWAAPPEAPAAPAAEPGPTGAPGEAWGDAGASPEPDLLSLGEVELTPEPPPPAGSTADAAALPFDPDAPFDHAKWFGHGAGEAAAAPEPAPAAPPGLDQPLAAEPPLPAFGEYDDAAAAPPLLDPLDLTLDEVAAAPDPTSGEAPGAGPGLDGPPADLEPLDLEAAAAPTAHVPAPAGAPFGDYDEAAAPPAAAADGALEAMLPFDPAAASAIEPGAMPEGYEPGGPSIDPAALPPADGAYDEAAAFAADHMYGGPEGDSLPGGTPLELGAALPDWQPEAAVEQGFELASDGSFGHPAVIPGARTPAWGTAAAAPTEGWESAPALDLAAPFEAPAAAPAPTPPPRLEPDELPTLDGAELLEELPAEEAAPLLDPAAADLTSLDGAFEQEATVEAAAYPPPDAPAAADLLTEVPPEPLLEPVLEPVPEPGPPAGPVAATALPFPHEPEPAVSYVPAPEGLPPEIAAAYADAASAPAAFELPPAVSGLHLDGLAEPVLEPEPLPEQAPAISVPGSHRVVLHTVDGQVKRGLLVDALLDAASLPLQPQGTGSAEEIPTEEIKAIFFMLSPGEKAPSPEGKKVRVTFRDGRQVAGFSPDYQEGLVGFFMIPADTRTNTGRIWVYQSAVKAVAVS